MFTKRVKINKRGSVQTVSPPALPSTCRETVWKGEPSLHVETFQAIGDAEKSDTFQSHGDVTLKIVLFIECPIVVYNLIMQSTHCALPPLPQQTGYSFY